MAYTKTDLGLPEATPNPEMVDALSLKEKVALNEQGQPVDLRFGKSSTTIDAQSVQPTDSVVVPPTTPVNTSSPIIAAKTSAYVPKTFTTPSGAVVTANGELVSPAPAAPERSPESASTLSTITTGIASLLESFKARPSGAGALKTALSETTYADSQSRKTQAQQELSSLQTTFAKLDESEKLLVENLAGQGRGLTDSMLSGQAARIQRQYSIQKAAVAAEMAAKTSYINALSGDIQTALNYAKDAADLVVADYDQQISDRISLVNANTNIYAQLAATDRQAYEARTKALEDAREKKRNDTLKVLEWGAERPTAGITINDTLESAYSKYVAAGGKRTAAASEDALGKTIDAVDLQRYVSAYPDLAGQFFPGMTNKQAQDIVLGSRKPRTFSDSELTMFAMTAKGKKTRYDDLIAQTENDPLILNKARAKQIVAQVYGKEDPTADTGVKQMMSLDEFFSGRRKASSVLTGL